MGCTHFIILGGGCYGSFYARQLLRGADRIGVGKIHIVDQNPDCQAKREFGGSSDAVVFHFEDWRKFLFAYFDEALKKKSEGGEIADQYVPPTFAPHILLELFLEKAKREDPSLVFTPKPFETPAGTPFDTLLPAGTRALSFATWKCPHSCIEPSTCPHTRGPKSWDMKEYLTEHLKKITDSVHFFQCRHFAMGVGTISVDKILDEYLKFQEVVRVPGTHLSAMATISSCHGLAGLVEVSHAPTGDLPHDGRLPA